MDTVQQAPQRPMSSSLGGQSAGAGQGKSPRAEPLFDLVATSLNRLTSNVGSLAARLELTMNGIRGPVPSSGQMNSPAVNGPPPFKEALIYLELQQLENVVRHLQIQVERVETL